jgi:SAM-dependent methyltransferase/methyltransferase-like protein
MNAAHPGPASRNATSYAEMPYESYPFRQTHPDKLATLSVLLGLEPPPLPSCRVLELGCTSGGNLLPLAVAYPHAQFAGVDVSAVQIAQGQAVVDASGLGNVRLLARSVTDIDERLGKFDYIIAHDLYSWVSNSVQEAILDVCSRNLTEQGVAYVSYNTLPGWQMQGMIRDLMRSHTLGFAEPGKRVQQARALLDFLAQSVSKDNNASRLSLQGNLELLRKLPDHSILHEHLEETNEPLYFHQFIERAERHGLQYLAEADFGTMLTFGFPPQVAETVRRIAPDVPRQEQVMDFLRNRSLRQTLLVHAGRKIDRNILPERVLGLWVCGQIHAQRKMPDLRAGVMEKFSTAAGVSVTTSNAITKGALLVLGERWPQSLAFAELLGAAHNRVHKMAASGASTQDRQTLANDLLSGYANGLVELHAAGSPFQARAGERPAVSALARWQAQAGRPITTLRHEVLHPTTAIRSLLPLLDGRRDHAMILSSTIGVDDAQLEAVLNDLARAALLIG